MFIDWNNYKKWNNPKYLFLDDIHYDKANGKDNTALFCGAFDKMKSRFEQPAGIKWITTRFTILKEIKKVIFNNPATIILWTDGTKTVVKIQDGEKYDKQTGFLMCYLKGIVGNKALLKEIDKWVDEKE